MDVRPYIFSNNLFIQNKEPLRYYSGSIYSLLQFFLNVLSEFHIFTFAVFNKYEKTEVEQS